MCSGCNETATLINANPDYQADDSLHVVNLLPEENIHRGVGTHLFEPVLHLVRHKVRRQLLEELDAHPGDRVFAGLAAAAARLLGLDVKDRREGVTGHLGLARDVGVGMEAEHAWRVEGLVVLPARSWQRS